jgi:hypothetical protein
MGGGASILAAAADPRVRTLANLAAAETNPSAISASASLAIPVCLISGSQDTIVPHGNNGQLMYDDAPPPRQLPLILGGYHCGFIDSNSIFCDSGSISRSAPLAITRRLLTAWFNLYLKQDQSVWPLVWGELMISTTDVTTTFDPGVVVEPSAFWVAGHTGTDALVDVVIRNTGALSASYSLFVSEDLWPGLIIPASTGLLGPAEETAVTLAITLPEQTIPSDDRALVSARSDEDGATRGWALVDVHLTPDPDFDLDHDVDLDDYAAFESCSSGPAVPPASGCEDKDLDDDEDVDQSDFGVFQRCISGEGNSADPNCAD